MWGAGQPACAPSQRGTAAHRTAVASDADRQLWNAAHVGSVADIERLIAAGADPNVFLEILGRFKSPLLTAAREGHGDAAAALLRAGALVDGSHADGLTALMGAATFGHTTMVDALLGAGADVSRACDDGDTSLHFSCRRRHHDTVKALLEAGARTDLRNSRGRRPFQVVRACVSCRGVWAHLSVLGRHVCDGYPACAACRWAPLTWTACWITP
jgi:ankyrin repeat protein